MGKKFFAAVLTAVLALPLGAANAAALRDVFKRVSGSVVVVLAESKSPGALGNQGPADVGGLGSGVLISQSGRILTAAHVVEAADRVTDQVCRWGRRGSTRRRVRPSGGPRAAGGDPGAAGRSRRPDRRLGQG